MTLNEINKFAEDAASTRYYKEHPKYWAFIEGVKAGAAFRQPLIEMLRAELELQNKEIELLEERYKAGVESAQPEWISVDDAIKPKLDELCLTYGPQLGLRLIFYGIVSFSWPSDVTHWQSLPPLPPAKNQ